MPRKPEAVPIARMACMTPGCGKRAAVYQSVRHYLYTRCPVCGCNQSNGPDHQVAVWQRMEPIKGAAGDDGVPLVIHRPRNVPESAGAIGCALTGTAPAVTVIEPAEPAAVPEKPVREPVPVPAETGAVAAVDPVPETKKPAPAPIGADVKRGGGGGFWVALSVLALAVGGGVAWMTKDGKAA
jgi:hypothetical protein